MPEAPSPAPEAVPVSGDEALLERFDALGIDSGADTSASEWLRAAYAWLTDGWSPELPALAGGLGLAQGALVCIAGLLAAAAVVWLLRRRRTRPSQQAAEPPPSPLLADTDPDTQLAAALEQGDVEGGLAACWRLVERALERSGRAEQRAERSAYELVAAVEASGPSPSELTVDLRALAQTYVSLRYGARGATVGDARQLAGSVRAFTQRLDP